MLTDATLFAGIPDVVIQNVNGFRAKYVLPTLPKTTFGATSIYNISLKPTSPWTFEPPGITLADVLSNVAEFRIRSEFSTSATAQLDNVIVWGM